MKFILGVLIGTAVGLIFAPAPGEETREQLYERAREYADIPQQKAADLIEQNKDKIGDIGARVAREAAEAAVESVTQELRNPKTA